MTTLTDEQLANLRQLADAATPGPWEPWDGSLHVGFAHWVVAGSYRVTRSNNVDDTRFIIAARTAVPELLDALAATTKRAEDAVQEKHEWAGRNLELVFEMETVKRERDELAAKLAAVPIATLRHLESEQPIDTNDPNEMRWCEVDEWLRTLEPQEAQP